MKTRRDMARTYFTVGQTVQVLYDPQNPAAFDVI